MSDKDYSGCEFYKQTTGECLYRNLKHLVQRNSNFCDCPQNKNCYYKQLQAKTQECENLIAVNSFLDDMTNNQCRTITELYRKIDTMEAYSLMNRVGSNKPRKKLLPSNKKLKQENTVLKQQLDISVGALETIPENEIFCFEKNSIIWRCATIGEFEQCIVCPISIAKTALDKIKEN